MKNLLFVFIFALAMISCNGLFTKTENVNDSINVETADTLLNDVDTLINVVDTLAVDSAVVE